jgi:quercetin dioxygenase-like cupin family protein
MPFFELEEAKAESLFGTLKRRVIAHGGKLMAVHVELSAGSVAPAHRHPHEQITYVVSGRLSYRIGERTQELAAGDSTYVPPDTEHEITAVEDAVVVDIFSPQREDFL